MANNVVDTIFRFVADRQATNRLLGEMDKIDRAYEDQAKAAKQTEQAVEDLEDAQKKSAEAARKASDASIRAAKEQSELVGDVASRTSQLSGAIAGLGAVGGQRLMIAADILDAAEAARLLQSEFPAMISQMAGARKQLLLFGGIGVAFGAAMLALNEYNKRKEEEKRLLEETRQGVRDYVNELIELNIFLVDATQAEIKARAAEEQKVLDGLVTTRGDIENEFNDMLLALVEQYGDTLPEEISSRLSEIDIDDPSFRVLENILSSLEVAGAITEEQEKDIRHQLAALGELGVQYDDINGKIEKQNEALEDLGENLTPDFWSNLFSDAKLKAGDLKGLFSGAFGDLLDVATENAEAAAMIAGTSSGLLEDVAGKREEENAAIVETIKLEAARVDVVGAGAELIAKAEIKRAEIARETAESILNIQRETDAKRAKLITDNAANLSDLTAKFGSDRSKLEQEHHADIAELANDFQADSLRDLQDFQRERERAEEDHRDTLLDAAGRLDAIAILNERRSFSKETRRADEDFKTEQERREKEFKEKLKQSDLAFKQEQQQLARNFTKRHAELRDSLARELNELRTAHRRRIADIRTNAQQRIAEVNAGLERELRALTGFTQQEVAIRDEHYRIMEEQLARFVGEANTIVSGLNAGAGLGTGGGEGGGPSVAAVGQFPLASSSAAPSPLASPMAMMPPVARSVSTTNNMPQVTNTFNGMDRLTPGQIRNVVKIVNDEMVRAMAS